MSRSPTEMLDALMEAYLINSTNLCRQLGVSTNTFTRIRKGGMISARLAVLLDHHGYDGTGMFREQATWQLEQITPEQRKEILKDVKPLN